MNKKKLIVFDLDQTLAKSKLSIDSEMSELLAELLRVKKVAVISGGKYEQFEKQFLKTLDVPEELLPGLFLLPTSGTSFYKYEDGWRRVYHETLPKEEREKIIFSIKKALQSAEIETPRKLYGEQIEDRESQITFSALGQKAPLEEKLKWDPDLEKRKKIKAVLAPLIPNFEVQIGGSTSIDVTKKGVNKGYGIKQMERLLKIPLGDMLFVGDRLIEGGNDYSVTKTGVDWIEVSGPEETKNIIRNLLNAGN